MGLFGFSVFVIVGVIATGVVALFWLVDRLRSDRSGRTRSGGHTGGLSASGTIDDGAGDGGGGGA